ncbi:hypothetical protein KQX54_020011 [Cotesia glomerata]|uniref:Uncharacterized protein n=1 Tax=Cotesia glomerata TaxID=32391 RepID=A0AAV7IFP2_COTGL|nr:hypothetical protein KQX54_020011 [Cotesia glomerata]
MEVKRNEIKSRDEERNGKIRESRIRYLKKQYKKIGEQKPKLEEENKVEEKNPSECVRQDEVDDIPLHRKFTSITITSENRVNLKRDRSFYANPQSKDRPVDFDGLSSTPFILDRQESSPSNK